MAACTGIIAGCEEVGERAEISAVPNAMILFNPVLDTTDKGYGSKNLKPEQQTELSPCHHVRKGIVPTIVFHGTADKTVPFENAERFARLMKEAGNECVLVPFEGKDHGFFNGSSFRKGNGDAAYEVTMKRSIEFLTSLGLLGGKQPARKTCDEIEMRMLTQFLRPSIPSQSDHSMKPTTTSLIRAALSLLLVALTFTPPSAKAAPAQPNIILVMPDDVGYGDYACLGNPIMRTPAVDAFKKQSLLLHAVSCEPDLLADARGADERAA